MDIRFIPIVASFFGGVIITLLGAWIRKKHAATKCSHEHLIWRYQKQLECYREFFELWKHITTDTDYVESIGRRYESKRECEESASRHAMRIAAPFLAEFGFIFGNDLTIEATNLLKGAATRILTASSHYPLFTYMIKKSNLPVSLKGL